MIVVNNTNGKRFNIPKDKFMGMTVKQRANFRIVDENDAVESTEQIVKNVSETKVAKKTVTPPDSGEKKK